MSLTTTRRTRRSGRFIGLVSVSALLATALVAQAPAASADVGSLKDAVADSGSKVIKETVIDARTVDLTLSTKSVGETTVRLQLPKDWGTQPAWRFPTLYLFGGGGEPKDYLAWTNFTKIEQLLANENVLVAMPSGGLSAVYTDEYQLLRKGPKWETFHTVELPQILQRAYRSNGANAVGGISSGGFGALIYTARHPGMYRYTASYSGLTDLWDPTAKLAVLQSRVRSGMSLNPWGPLLLNVMNTSAHNPMQQLSKYKNQPMYVSAGRGHEGPLDNADPNYKDQVGGRIIEAATGQMNDRFVLGLKLVGAKPTVHMYDEGLHFWTYWDRELALSYPLIKKALGEPTTAQVPGALITNPPKPQGLFPLLFGGLFG